MAVTGALQIDPGGGEYTGLCPCCGDVSRLVRGAARRAGVQLAIYSVHWTLGRIPEHGAHVDLIVDVWRDDTARVESCAVSLLYRLTENGSGFMVTVSSERDVAKSERVSRALNRENVIGDPLAQDIFAICDAITAQDHRLGELQGGSPAPPRFRVTMTQGSRLF